MEEKYDFYEIGKNFAKQTVDIFKKKLEEIENRFGKQAASNFEMGFLAEYRQYDDPGTLRTDEDDIFDHLENHGYDNPNNEIDY